MIIIGIKIINREESAPELQDILTEYGCIIKTRLGIHEAKNCSSDGIIILEIIDDKKAKELINELSDLDGMEIQIMQFN